MSRAESFSGIRIHTIGHSTRSFDELAELLRAFEVSVLVDVRTMPRSRKNPQFNRDTIAPALLPHGVRYVHLPELGGLRRPNEDSPNTGWRNASFRGFADYMQTDEFELGLSRLHELATAGHVAVMCAEAVPWRCHRSLIADAVTSRGAHVEHITGRKSSSSHRMTPFAKVVGERVTYPASDPSAP